MDADRRRRRNALNLSTGCGRVLARVGRARLQDGPGGVSYAVGYRLPVPPAPAFTVGDVIFLRRAELLDRPALLAHEARHTVHYARFGGVLLLPMYFLASGWSWVRTGDFSSRNAFERSAGLADGGYRERPLRGVWSRGTLPPPGRPH